MQRKPVMVMTGLKTEVFAAELFWSLMKPES